MHRYSRSQHCAIVLRCRNLQSIPLARSRNSLPCAQSTPTFCESQKGYRIQATHTDRQHERGECGHCTRGRVSMHTLVSYRRWQRNPQGLESSHVSCHHAALCGELQRLDFHTCSESLVYGKIFLYSCFRGSSISARRERLGYNVHLNVFRFCRTHKGINDFPYVVVDTYTFTDIDGEVGSHRNIVQFP